MTEQELQAIRERAEKATPGPWGINNMDGPIDDEGPDIYAEPYRKFLSDGSGYPNWYDPGQYVATLRVPRWDANDFYHVTEEVWAKVYESQANAEFIAHARTDIPALLAEVQRLRGALRRARDRINNAYAYDSSSHYIVDEECEDIGLDLDSVSPTP